MNIIEELRKKAVQGLPIDMSTKQSWKTIYEPLIGLNPKSADILNLGRHLREFFHSTRGEGGRGQKEVSQAGAVWESLVVWYVNLCCSGSRVVAFKGLANVPAIIKEAVSVTYGTLPCTAEPDVIVMIFPDRAIYTDSNLFSSFNNRQGKFDKKRLNAEVKNDFSLFEIGVIQCKTNWNENAQIPMLWDIIYKTPIGRLQGIKVGTPPYSIAYVPFTYAFVTVPTNKLEIYKPTSIPVARVKNLSGGNYWGVESASGVALSLDYIFQANYPNGFVNGNINNTLTDAIPEMADGHQYDYFFK